MLKLTRTLTLLLIRCAPAFGQGGGATRLRDVRGVYVAELGTSEWAKVVREKLVRELARRFRVVDAPAEADAVLDSAVHESARNVDRPYQDFESQIRTGTEVVPARRLVFSLRSKQRHALWSLKLDADNYHGGDEYHKALALAARVGGDVLKAYDKETRKRG